MQRKLESRLEALEKVSDKDCTDVVIRRLSVAGDPVLKTTNGARQWLRAAGESLKDFNRRAFGEMEIPANGMRVLILEGTP
jgi:hypothetical protein